MQYPVKAAAILAALSMITACASAPTGGPGTKDSPYKITIEFADAKSCEITGVTEEPTICTKPNSGFCIGQAEWVQWQSKPSGIQYEVFFDPINGRPFMSGGNGILKRKIDQTAPWAKYKYSILRKNCDPKTDAYDPHIRVDK
jgi:hypothetical protein